MLCFLFKSFEGDSFPTLPKYAIFKLSLNTINPSICCPLFNLFPKKANWESCQELPPSPHRNSHYPGFLPIRNLVVLLCFFKNMEGVSGILLRWHQMFFSDYTQRIMINIFSSTSTSINSGVSLGSILSTHIDQDLYKAIGKRCETAWIEMSVIFRWHPALQQIQTAVSQLSNVLVKISNLI